MDRRYVFVAIGLVLVLGVGMLTRGIRNNNPGNIKHSNSDWLGMRDTQTDKTFVQFVSDEYGFRALAKTLQTYKYRHEIDTVAGIIKRYAPDSDGNPTEAYAKYVADRLGVGVNQTININERMGALLAAISRYETGKEYSSDIIDKGLALV